MALRIRKDGRILCAALHPEEPEDIYVHDGISYELSVIAGVLVTDAKHLRDGDKVGHGEWWWVTDRPDLIGTNGNEGVR